MARTRVVRGAVNPTRRRRRPGLIFSGGDGGQPAVSPETKHERFLRLCAIRLPELAHTIADVAGVGSWAADLTDEEVDRIVDAVEREADTVVTAFELRNVYGHLFDLGRDLGGKAQKTLNARMGRFYLAVEQIRKVANTEYQEYSEIDIANIRLMIDQKVDELHRVLKGLVHARRDYVRTTRRPRKDK